MNGSVKYWSVAETVKHELDALSCAGTDMFSDLESNDSPVEVADALVDIEKRLAKPAGQISANVPGLRKIQKALDDLPGVR